jgi:hypothetical protein
MVSAAVAVLEVAAYTAIRAASASVAVEVSGTLGPKTFLPHVPLLQVLLPQPISTAISHRYKISFVKPALLNNTVAVNPLDQALHEPLIIHTQFHHRATGDYGVDLNVVASFEGSHSSP